MHAVMAGTAGERAWGGWGGGGARGSMQLYKQADAYMEMEINFPVTVDDRG